MRLAQESSPHQTPHRELLNSPVLPELTQAGRAFHRATKFVLTRSCAQSRRQIARVPLHPDASKRRD